MNDRRTRAKTTMLLASAALSGSAALALAGSAQAETPEARSPNMHAEGGVLVCRVESGTKYAACTPAQIVANARAAARALLAATKDVANVPEPARYAACKIGNSKGRSLPEAYQETMIMRLVEGMSGPEIAEATGLTPESVRVNLCRGMKLLRARLGEEGA